MMASAKTSRSPAKINANLLQAMAEVFTISALPGENEGFDAKACDESPK